MIRITDKSKCCGCTACVAACPVRCITMQEDSEGFMYPKVNESECVGCNLCLNVCPAIHYGDSCRPSEIYAAKTNDDKIRMSSSSGGIFSLLAENIIDDGGVVFGAEFNDRWEVIHSYEETRAGLAGFRGSKYVQSYMGNSYRDAKTFLDRGRMVLFSGTPCQIAGLKHFLKKDYDNLLTVDLICHGVPSPSVWNEYLYELKVKSGAEAISAIEFRDKSEGWKNFKILVEGYNQGNKFLLEDESFYINNYCKAFLNNISLRPSCFACPVKAGKSGSDITLGDYWGMKDAGSELNDDKGCSVVLVNTPKGSSFIAALPAYMKSDIKYEWVLDFNPSLEKSAGLSPNRDFFFYMLFRRRKSFSKAIARTMDKVLIWRLRRLIYRRMGV